MKKSVLGLLLALMALTLTTPAIALLLPLTYSNVNGSGTYGALQLTDIAGGVQVAANYNASFFAPTAGSFGVQDVYLNLIPRSYTGSVTFTQSGIQNSGPGSWSLVTTARADGLGIFNFDATSKGAGARIPIAASSTGTFTTLFTLTASGLTADDFLAYSKDNQGDDTPWIGAMHLAGYTTDPVIYDKDGKPIPSSFLAATAPVPIPSAAWLLGSGIIGLIGLKRRANKGGKSVSW